MRRAVAIGAAVVAVLLGAGSVYQLTSADRELGEAYRATLELGRGSSFAAAPITGPQGRVGTVFAYQGDPSWVMVTLDFQSEAPMTYTVQVVTRNGAYLDLEEAVFDPGDRTWGETLPVDIGDVQAIRFLDSEGRVGFSALVDPDDPWD